MKKIGIFILFLTGLSSLYAEVNPLVSNGTVERMSVGLVLSGGGAKGIAHAGVIQALEENGIPIDYIAGTSMGAIVGGLYASGYTPNEIIELILSDEFTSWSTGKIDPSLTYYYLKQETTPAIVKLNLGKKDASVAKSILPSSLINPIPMNFGFMELFLPHTAACNGDFNNLFVPFRCVTSDVYNKKKIVLSDGDLGEAIRMSMTFPVAFKPIERDSIPMFDGGIYDNFPVDVMKDDFAPDFIIGVDVTTHEKTDMTSLFSQLETMVIQQDDYSLPEEDGIKIHIDLKGFGLLDFPKAAEIFEKGYKKTMLMMDSIKTRVRGRLSEKNAEMRRDVYKSKVPHVFFDSLSVSGTGEREEKYIRRMFFKKEKDSIDIAGAKDAYYRIITTGKFRDLVPSPESGVQKGGYKLRLKAATKDNFGLGVGGFITSTTNSMAFISANYGTTALNSFTGEVMGWVGQSYYGGLLNGRIATHSSVPTVLKLQMGVSQQKFHEDEVLFFENDAPAFLAMNQWYANFLFGIGVGRHSKIEVMAGYGDLRDKFYPDKNVDFTSVKQDEARYRLGRINIAYDYNTLNSDVYPTSGLRCMAGISGMLGKKRYASAGNPSLTTDFNNVKWAELEFDVQNYFELSKKFKLGTRLDVLASTKELYENYTATIIQAPDFSPTQASRGVFHPSFRSNAFVAGGIIPVFKLMDNLQLRTEFYAFSPMKRIGCGGDGKPYYGDWFGTVDFMGEVSFVYNLPFAALSLYGNYINSSAKNWSVGISFGFFITVPKFIR